ncbi:MAG TPA: hypothetical protein VGJ47_02735 [Gemmatimonadaceae bacterium]
MTTRDRVVGDVDGASHLSRSCHRSDVRVEAAGVGPWDAIIREGRSKVSPRLGFV